MNKKQQQQDDILKAYLIIRVIMFFITPAIIMGCYNYVGPAVSAMFTGKSKEQSENDFVEIGFWQSFVLYILASILFKSVC